MPETKDTLQESWNSFSESRASAYLKTFGNPSLDSKKILLKILEKMSEKDKISIVDMGCGNAQLYEFFKENNLNCSYVGVDFSETLLKAAKKANPTAIFVEDDICKLEKVVGHFDVAIYSHTIEMIPSPEASLIKASQIADTVIIRFFEPPEFDVDTVELKTMETAEGLKVPYLRRKMSKDYYKMILKKINRNPKIIKSNSKDQIHILTKIKQKKWQLF
jgi:ubiquinone/menaquinone biosynthesis C-methylase UbiE